LKKKKETVEAKKKLMETGQQQVEEAQRNKNNDGRSHEGAILFREAIVGTMCSALCE
jgi:hypothetical protein